MRTLPISLVALGLLLGCTASLTAGSPRQHDPIVGCYGWHNGNRVEIRADGTATSGEYQGGRWMANPYGGSGYVIMWEGGYVESLKLKGSRLEGSGLDAGGNSYGVWGNRQR